MPSPLRTHPGGNTLLRLAAAGVASFLLLAGAALHAAPTVAVINPPPGTTVASLTSVSVTFSEPVTGVNATDLGVNGELIVAVTGSGAGPYVFTFPQPGPGNVTLAWDVDQSIAGIGTGELATPAGWSYTLTDSIAPTAGKIRTSVAGQEMEDVRPIPGATVGSVKGATVTFSEAVTGVNAGDLLVNGVPAATVTGDAAGPYGFTFPEPGPGAAVVFTWAAGHGIQDLSGNAFAGAGWSVVREASAGQVQIAEFLVSNGGTVVAAGSDPDGTRDENWDLSSWIELYNPGPSPVNLLGWSLTDNTANPGQWVFPARTLAAGGRLIVFASGKDRKPASGNLHTNFGLSANGGTVALYSPDTPAGLPASAWENYPPQRYDYSFGAQAGDGQARYFSPPSVSQGAYTLPSSDIGGTAGTVPPAPAGVANGASLLTGVTPEPHASVARGFFNEPFSVALSCPDAGATLRYTLDGSPPLATSPSYSAPLDVTGTTVLRMAAFGTDKVPSRTVTHTYLFPDQVVNQASPPYDNPALTTDNTNPQPPAPGGNPLPIAWGTSGTFTAAQTLPGFPTGSATGANNLTAGQIPADYGMDPKVWADPNKYSNTGAVDAVNGKTNLERIKNALRTQPALSLVIKSADMFGAYPNGTVPAGTIDPLYPTSSSGIKRDMTKACSLELMQPDGTVVFVTDAGIDLHGNASRDPFKNPKHGFTIRFKGKFGAGKVEGRLFPDSPVREWDKLILRGDFGGSWLHQNGTDGMGAGSDSYQRPRGIRIREAFCKDTFREMGRVASHHRFCNLFINGVCWGSYELMEDQAEDFSASYLGGDKDAHDVVDQGKLKSGTWHVWSSIKTLLGWTGGTAATDNTTPPSNYTNTFTHAQYETLRTLLDVPWFQDYMIWQTWAGHRDWATDAGDAGKYMKNVYFIRPKGGTFKAMPWDMENLLWHESEDRVTGMTTFTTTPSLFPPAVIHPRAKTNAEYRQEFADRAWRHLIRPGGALTPAANIARLNKWTAAYGVDEVVLESARWGDYRYKVHAYTTGTTTQVYTWNGAWYDNATAAQYNGTWAAGVQRFNTGRAQASQLGIYSGGMSNAWYDEIRRLTTVYFPARTNNVLTQYRNNGLYPFLNAPELHNHATDANLGDAQVPAGTMVKLVMPAAGTGSSLGDIYYTLDGTDPRAAYDFTGTPRAGATLYAAPFAINGPTVVKARALAKPANFPSKAPVRLATTASMTVTYAATGGTSGRGQITAAPSVIDGQTLADNDRILLKNQATPAQNGIWVVTTAGTGATGVWDRAEDWDGDGEVVTNTWVRATAGLQNKDNVWRVTTAGTIIVGGASGTGVTFTTAGFSPWSALMEITLQAGPPAATVCFSEIHYNPRSNQGGSAVEFVEFLNHGALPVDMTSWSMDGINFIFPAGTILKPEQRVVIASNNNPVTFAAQYPGVVPLGYFGGSLDNGGERLSLLDAKGNVVCTVEYNDDAPWPAGADNGGSSLELIHAGGDLQSAANWQASAAANGTPGAANSTSVSAVTISEFFAAGGAGVQLIRPPGSTLPLGPLSDFVELRNTSGTAVDLTGWTLHGAPLPAGTSIAAGTRLVVWCTAGTATGVVLPFPLNKEGGEIMLRDAAGIAVDGVRYGPQSYFESFMRQGGGWEFAVPTAGEENYVRQYTVSDRVAINEVMANPGPGEDDWIEIFNDNDTAIELSGCFLECNGEVFAIAAPMAAGDDSYVRLYCNAGGQSGNTLNLDLPAAGATLTLRDAAWNVLDTLTYGPQQTGITQGRLPDGGAPLVTLTYPSPGQANSVLPAERLRLNEVMVINLNGDNTPWGTREPWVELHNATGSAVNAGGWTLRSVMAHSQAGALVIPQGTVIPAGGYLTFWASAGWPFDTFEYDHHGFELANAEGVMQDRIIWGLQVEDKSIGRVNGGSWALLATPTRGAANSAAQVLSPATGVKINEWQGEAPNGANRGEFIELYNPGANPAALGGLWLSDEPSEAGRRKHQIPELSFIGGNRHAVFRPEGEINGDYPNGAPLWPFSYTFRIATGGEMLRLSLDDAGATAIDSVTFGPPPVTPQSAGRLPDGSATTGTLKASPGWPNASGPLPYFMRQPEEVVVTLGKPFTLHAYSELTTTYRWQRDSVEVLPPTAPGGAGVSFGRGTSTLADDGVYTCFITNAEGTTASRAVRVTVLYTYALWSAAYGAGDSTADPDADGLTNAEEFFSGTNPTARSSVAAGIQGGSEVIAGINHLTLEYTVSRRAAYTALTGQRSSDLSVWVDAVPAATETVNTQPNGDYRVKVKFPWAPGDDREFVRLRLTP